VKTNPGAEWGGLGVIASGGELARFALALKAALSTRGGPELATLVMIFDEVDQGVGGAVADAVGLRLKRLAERSQVIVVTHSPQVAARGDQHLKVSKSVYGADGTESVKSTVQQLDEAETLEELARMLAGAEITPEARAAAQRLRAAELV
ncbi:MAG: DNA repair protein RecN, partial [Asticcacaulis sp.]|nr:DNA repair protein RecN [Asticcacaulis sp.]